MPTKVYPYRYNKQFATYIAQFMRVLSGFQVQDGVERDGETPTYRVPVVYGNMSRIVASILNKRNSLTTRKLPIIAVNMVGIEPDQNNRRSAIHRDEIASQYTDLPEGKKVVQRAFGPAYMLSMEASIYASSNTELFQILEQMLMIFNPRVQIQIDNDAFNSDFITDIQLSGINPDFQYPMGTESQEIMLGLNFLIPVRIRYPMGFNDSIIEAIRSNIIDGNSEEPLIDETVIGEL